jgi:tetratricopeptide (TPR) repeat protein
MGTIVTQSMGGDLLWNFNPPLLLHTSGLQQHVSGVGVIPWHVTIGDSCMRGNQNVADRWGEVATRRLKLEDWEGAVGVFKELVHNNPTEQWYQDELNRALVNGGTEDAIAVWADLVTANPGERNLHNHLSNACLMEIEKATEAVTAWQGIVERHPDHDILYFRLNMALRDAGTAEKQVTAIWSQILDKNRQSTQLRTHLYGSLSLLGTEKQLAVWKSVALRYPELAKYGPTILPEVPRVVERPAKRAPVELWWRCTMHLGACGLCCTDCALFMNGF